MSARSVRNRTRRGFLESTLALAGAMPFIPSVFAASADATRSEAVASRYRVLNADEAAFTENMVNALCPADHLTLDGVSSGLATFIDRQLAGDFNAGVARSAPAGQKQLFKAGLAAADRACHARFGIPFHRLPSSDARGFLHDMAAGRVDADFPLAAWSTQIVDPLLTQACFTGPVYDAYGTKMFWKLFGYVTGPARQIEG